MGGQRCALQRRLRWAAVSSERLRLGLVGPVPPPSGGMANQTRQLRKLLEADGNRVVFLPTNPPYKPQWVASLKGFRALFRLIPYVFSAWRLAGRVDVIHMMANSGWSWQLFSAPVVWSGWLRGTPVIVNYRGGEALSYLNASFSQVKPTIDRSACIVVPSAFLQQVFAGFGITCQVIPNIIDLARFRPPTQRTESAEFNLVITRNLEPIYGIDTAIRAFALASQREPGLRLLIAGSGPQRAELEQLAKDLDIQQRVEFLGRLEPEQVVSLYQRADAMLNPTTVDNMPNSVLEALACGVPVISSDVGGVPYIVENEVTALLVPCGNVARMAEAIQRLHEDENLRTNLINAGLDEVRKYTWERVGNLWNDLYRSCARGVPV